MHSLLRVGKLPHVSHTDSVVGFCDIYDFEQVNLQNLCFNSETIHFSFTELLVLGLELLSEHVLQTISHCYDCFNTVMLIDSWHTRVLLAKSCIQLIHSYYFYHITIAFPTILNSSFSTFTYPTYPSRYPPATEHTWLIKVEEGKHINLTLHVIDVEAYRGKCIDIIEIKDGDNSKAPLLGKYKLW